MVARFVLIMIYLELTLTGCQSTSRIVISGEPGIEIFKVGPNVSEQSLGKLPLDLDSGQLFGSNENTLQLTASKGTLSQSLLIMRPQMPGTYDIKINFSREAPQAQAAAAASCDTSASDHRDYALLAKSIAESQFLIMRKNYQAAQIKLIALSNQFPDIAVVHDLLGNSYYLAKDFSESLKAYEKSLSIDANNTAAAQMVERLKQIVKSE